MASTTSSPSLDLADLCRSTIRSVLAWTIAMAALGLVLKVIVGG